MNDRVEQTLTLSLSVNELNLLFGALQELPHKIVDPLIRKIQVQVIEQTKKEEVIGSE